MEEIGLVEILKDCRIGTKLYSPVCGECSLMSVSPRKPFPIDVETAINVFSFTDDGRISFEENGECLLFPSKNQRDWSKFKEHEKSNDSIEDLNKRIDVLHEIIKKLDNKVHDIERKVSTVKEDIEYLGDHKFF